MVIVELRDDQKELEIEGTGSLTIGNAFVEQINHALDEMNKGVALTSFDFHQSSIDLIDNVAIYNYTITTKDGRLWIQTIKMSDPEVEHDFLVQGGRWKEESEFAKHRPVRGTCIHLAKTLGVTKVECVWF